MWKKVQLCFWLSSVLAAGIGPRDCGTDLCQLASDGTLPDLRWPDFQNYREDVLRLYKSSGGAPVWVRNGFATPTARSVIEALKAAGDEGLNPEDYDGSRWDGRIATLRAGGANRFDIALTVSVMRYASDLRFGRANPEGRPAGLFDLSTWVQQNLGIARDPKAAFLSLSPPFEGYWRARWTLGQYISLAREDSGEQLPSSKKPVEPGQTYPAVARLVDLLRRLGDLPAEFVPPDSQKYEGALVDAVKHFQARHGLDTDGRLGKGTLAALNTSLWQRVRQLQLTLERYRWIPRDSARPMIVVNIPEFRLRAFNANGGRPELEMKIVTGKADRLQTPVFGADMKYVIFRPYWNVPPSILRKELIPQIVRDRAYLAKNEFEVTTPSGQVVSTGIVSDEILSGLRSGRLQVRQRPGGKNALGGVKFVLPNENDVYLHDTPARGLFSRSRRDFSHGCIRLENPLDLAAWVLRNRPEWTRDRIVEAMNGSMPIQVDLPDPIPVSVVYWTAVVPENGAAYFFDDIYGRDAVLDQQLTSGESAPRPRG
jgi:murein L,D-transpeptidase YcbB/YkuD